MKLRNLLLFAFALFITCGNIPRVVPMGRFFSNISALELALYFLSAVSLWRYRNRMSRLWILPLFIILSTVYGVMLHGALVPCVLYACKLIAMLLAGWCVGHALYERFGADLPRMASWCVRFYSLNLLLGFLIFFIFPNATQFFCFMEQYGLLFKGDPHSFRFISPYLDPNYYSAIACIPLLLLRHAEKKRTLLQLLFFASILLSFSRSGIATYLLLFAIVLLPALRRNWPVKIGALCALLLLLGIGLFLSEPARDFFSRLFFIFEDTSAHARLSGLQIGWSYFTEYPLFGMGYHFLAKHFLGAGNVLSIDSSVMQSLVDFGLIPCLILLATGVVWGLNRFALYRGLPHYLFFKEFITYVLIVFIFSSLFNNILYYQFWLIPVISIFVYLGNLNENSAHS